MEAEACTGLWVGFKLFITVVSSLSFVFYQFVNIYLLIYSVVYLFPYRAVRSGLSNEMY